MITRRMFLAMPAVLAAAQTEGEAALARLMEGNRRFAHSRSKRPDESAGRRLTLSKGQHPFAIVLTCSDSRVAPELVFNTGLGDLFVVRVAGNIVDDAVLGSIEYAAEHLKVPLLFVLGHESCGAVKAAVDGVEEAHITSLAAAIRPAAERAKTMDGDVLDNAVRQNIRLVLDELTESKPVLAERIENCSLLLRGGRYDLRTGLVELIVPGEGDRA